MSPKLLMSANLAKIQTMHMVRYTIELQKLQFYHCKIGSKVTRLKAVSRHQRDLKQKKRQTTTAGDNQYLLLLHRCPFQIRRWNSISICRDNLTVGPCKWGRPDTYNILIVLIAFMGVLTDARVKPLKLTSSNEKKCLSECGDSSYTKMWVKCGFSE